MIAFIRGRLVHAATSSVIVDVGGLGYQVYIAASAYSRLPQIGSEITLQTLFVVRELSHTLYGFLTVQEREVFEALMGVTGIGPKLALSIVGNMEPRDLQRAIGNHDIASISKIPGIGKKTAERLIIELRDKLSLIFVNDPADLAVHFPSDPQSQKISDAMSTLINLGYNQSTAQKAIKKSLGDLSEDCDLAAVITGALKHV